MDASNNGSLINVGILKQDLLFQVKNSTYRIDGNIIVLSGASIRIEQNTILSFVANTSLRIKGKETANGTQVNQIYFES
jgi:hypothetical protein